MIGDHAIGFAIACEGFKRNTLSAQPLWLGHLGWTDVDGAVLLDALRHAARTWTFADAADWASAASTATAPPPKS